MAEKEKEVRASELKLEEKGPTNGDVAVIDATTLEKGEEFNVVNRPPEGPGLGQKSGKVVRCDPEGREVKDHEQEQER
ncbi:MAG: hypothetical protein IKI57_03445 [Clostridia bacterium]|nr:hypothetical protein [Clostridia bacterium]